MKMPPTNTSLKTVADGRLVFKGTTTIEFLSTGRA